MNGYSSSELKKSTSVAAVAPVLRFVTQFVAVCLYLVCLSLYSRALCGTLLVCVGVITQVPGDI